MGQTAVIDKFLLNCVRAMHRSNKLSYCKLLLSCGLVKELMPNHVKHSLYDAKSGTFVVRSEKDDNMISILKPNEALKIDIVQSMKSIHLKRF